MDADRLPYFQFFVADWLLGDIQDFSYETQGRFVNLAAHMWRAGSPLQVDKKLCRKLRFDEMAELEAWLAELAETDIVQTSDGTVSIKFIREQLAERQAFIDKCRKNGKLGGRPQKNPPLTEPLPNPNPPLTEPKPNLKATEQNRTESEHNNVKQNNAPEAPFVKDTFPFVDEEPEDTEPEAPAKTSAPMIALYTDIYADYMNRHLHVTLDKFRMASALTAEFRRLANMGVTPERMAAACADDTKRVHEDHYRALDTPKKFVDDFLTIERKIAANPQRRLLDDVERTLAEMRKEA